MVRSDLIEDLSAITTMHKTSLAKLSEYATDCICYDLNEAIQSNDDTFCIDIGIGTLTIMYDDYSIKYRFTPSTKLEEGMIKVVNGEKVPLLEKAEDSIVKKIQKTYKELF